MRSTSTAGPGAKITRVVASPSRTASPPGYLRADASYVTADTDISDLSQFLGPRRAPESPKKVLKISYIQNAKLSPQASKMEKKEKEETGTFRPEAGPDRHMMMDMTLAPDYDAEGNRIKGSGTVYIGGQSQKIKFPKDSKLSNSWVEPEYTISAQHKVVYTPPALMQHAMQKGRAPQPRGGAAASKPSASKPSDADNQPATAAPGGVVPRPPLRPWRPNPSQPVRKPPPPPPIRSGAPGPHTSLQDENQDQPKLLDPSTASSANAGPGNLELEGLVRPKSSPAGGTSARSHGRPVERPATASRQPKYKYRPASAPCRRRQHPQGNVGGDRTLLNYSNVHFNHQLDHSSAGAPPLVGSLWQNQQQHQVFITKPSKLAQDGAADGAADGLDAANGAIHSTSETGSKARSLRVAGKERRSLTRPKAPSFSTDRRYGERFNAQSYQHPDTMLGQWGKRTQGWI